MPAIDEEGGSGREDGWAVVVARREGNGDENVGVLGGRGREGGENAQYM